MTRVDQNQKRNIFFREIPLIPWLYRSRFSPWLRLYPELRLIEEPMERFLILKPIWTRWAFRFNLVRAALLVFFLAMLVAILFGGAMYGLPRALLPAVVLSVMAPVLFATYYRSSIRKELRQVLREYGHHLCISCGYDLIGNASGRCPECGQPTLIHGESVMATKSSEANELPLVKLGND